MSDNNKENENEWTSLHQAAFEGNTTNLETEINKNVNNLSPR